MTSSTADADPGRTRLAWPGLIVVLLLVARGSTLTRGPHLQSVTATTAIVVWQTDQAGDSGTGSTAQVAVANQMVSLDPQFLLHTGDVVYPDGQAEGYDPFFFQPYQALARRAPIFPTLGNHDYVSQRGKPYLDAFFLPHSNPANTERYYSFDSGSAHFTALDFELGEQIFLPVVWKK